MKSAALFVLGVAAAFGQPTLTLSEAHRLALENNPQLNAAKFNASAQRQVPNEVRSNLAPQVVGLATGVGADSGSRLAAGALNNPAVYSRVASGITVNQLLSDFGRTRNLIDSARLHADAADQATEVTRAGVLLDVDRAFFNLLRAQAVLKVAQQTVGARQLVSDQITTLQQNQLKTTLDVSFANVNLSDAKLLLAQAQNDVRAAEAELARAMGVAFINTSTPPAAYSLADEPMPAALPATIEPLLQDALNNRPELKQLRLDQNSAETFVHAEHDLRKPTISALAAVGIVPAGESAVPDRYGAAGVNISIPIFNGGLFKARESEADFRAKAAAQNVNDQANRVARDVRVAYLNAQTAFERIGLTDQLLANARMAADLAQTRYDLGLSSIVELSQAQLNATAAEIAAAGARYDYQAQTSVLRFQTGSLR
jgi:outer membrane protein